MDHQHVIEKVPVDYYQYGIENNLLQKSWHMTKLEKVKEFITKSPTNVLDVGCASGWFIAKIKERFPNANFYGIDIYKDSIEYAKKLYPDIKFERADAHFLPYKDSFFDLVICTEVIEHLDDPRQAMSEIKRVLKKGGRFIIEVDSGSTLFSIVWFFWTKFRGRVWNEAHLHSFNIAKLENLARKNGFKVLKKKKFSLGMAMIFLLEK